MPLFSESEINEAKKRVREMQSRASSLVDDNSHSRDKLSCVPESKSDSSEKQSFKPFENQDDSSLIILALIMLLSKEGADNKLLFALLYLLL